MHGGDARVEEEWQNYYATTIFFFPITHASCSCHFQMQRHEELNKRMDVAIEEGYLNAPEIVTLCQASALHGGDVI